MKKHPVEFININTCNILIEFINIYKQVEALVHKEAEVPAALEKIHHLSSLLGEGEALLSFPCSSSECTHWANCRGCLEAISLRGIILAVF